MKHLTSYRVWLPLLLIMLAVYYSYQILHSSNVKRSKPAFKNEKMRVVKVAKLIRQDVTPTWQATGVVVPAEEVNIIAEVAGVVARVNEQAKPGNLLAQGQWLVELDKTDYQLNLQTQQAQLIQAQANFDLERAEQQLAKEELSFLNNGDHQIQANMEMALILREPQFKASQAKLAAAETNVEKAKVALARTEVVMPFDGKITKRNIGRGSKVGQNSTLFTVVNVAAFWLEVKVPRSFLNLIDKQQTVTLSQPRLWGEGKTRSARVVSVLAELDNKDRQAKLLLAIDDPLNSKIAANVQRPLVFINDFLTAELTGLAIKNAWTLATHWVMPDNSVWVVDKDKTMQKRHVDVLFKGRDLVYVTGDFQPGDLAVSEKPSVTAIGMKVRAKLADDEPINDENKFEKLNIEQAPAKNNNNGDKKPKADKERAKKERVNHSADTGE